jgi:hypothetical protein
MSDILKIKNEINSCLKSAVRVDQQKPFLSILANSQNSGIYFLKSENSTVHDEESLN